MQGGLALTPRRVAPRRQAPLDDGGAVTEVASVETVRNDSDDDSQSSLTVSNADPSATGVRWSIVRRRIAEGAYGAELQARVANAGSNALSQRWSQLLARG